MQVKSSFISLITVFCPPPKWKHINPLHQDPHWYPAPTYEFSHQDARITACKFVAPSHTSILFLQHSFSGITKDRPHISLPLTKTQGMSFANTWVKILTDMTTERHRYSVYSLTVDMHRIKCKQSKKWLSFTSILHTCATQGPRATNSGDRIQTVGEEKGTKGIEEAARQRAEGGKEEARAGGRGKEEVCITDWPWKGEFTCKEALTAKVYLKHL